MTDPLTHQSVEADVATEQELKKIAKDCAAKYDPDTLRSAASRIESIFSDYFTHPHFDADTYAFDEFIEGLRRSITALEP